MLRDEQIKQDIESHKELCELVAKAQELATQIEERKALAKWLEELPSAHSTGEYKGHYHLVTHLAIESLSRGEKP